MAIDAETPGINIWTSLGPLVYHTPKVAHILMARKFELNFAYIWFLCIGLALSFKVTNIKFNICHITLLQILEDILTPLSPQKNPFLQQLNRLVPNPIILVGSYGKLWFLNVNLKMIKQM